MPGHVDTHSVLQYVGVAAIVYFFFHRTEIHWVLDYRTVTGSNEICDWKLEEIFLVFSKNLRSLIIQCSHHTYALRLQYLLNSLCM
jgi:hypothetical protein